MQNAAPLLLLGQAWRAGQRQAMAISCLLRHRDDAASARSLHAAANESTSHESSQAVPQVPTVGLGQALPHLTRTGCIYLDYNATTPIFPEVRQVLWRRQQSTYLY